MLSRSFKKLTTTVRRMRESPGLSDGNPAEANKLGDACVRGHKGLGLGLFREWRKVWNIKRHKILG